MAVIKYSLSHISFASVIGNSCVSFFTEHLGFLSYPIHPSAIQQHLPVPMVGLCPWSISCFLFGAHGTTVVSLQYGCNSRNTETGTLKVTYTTYIWVIDCVHFCVLLWWINSASFLLNTQRLKLVTTPANDLFRAPLKKTLKSETCPSYKGHELCALKVPEKCLISNYVWKPFNIKGGQKCL